MDTPLIVLLCAAALGCIVIGALLKRNAARQRLYAREARPLREQQPVVVQQPFQHDDSVSESVQTAWRKCGTAHRAVERTPDCQPARDAYEQAIRQLRTLSQQLHENAPAAHVRATAFLAGQHADLACSHVAQFARYTAQR
jgi:hypothetical protein